MLIFVIVASLAFCVVRICKTPQEGGLRKADIFKDVAHIWVGYVLALAIAVDAGYWIVFAVLCVVEVVAVVAGIWM